MSSEQDVIDKIVAQSLEAIESRFRQHIRAAGSLCETPIERVLLAAFIGFDEALGPMCEMHICGTLDLSSWPVDGICIYPQARVDEYRLDFLLVRVAGGEPRRFVVVECDGHDFHERTKAQASRDKKRDRHFAKKGWLVLRYTGSDIWRSPGDCGLESLTVVGAFG